jgi:chromosome partitioning protein
MIITVGSIKGGSGKTTIATNLAVMRSATGKKVLLVDADEQKSTTTWVEQRINSNIKTSWTSIQLHGISLYKQILNLNEDYKDTIIDVGGRETTSLRAALTVSDIFLIPFQPRSLDIWTIGAIKTLLSEVEAINPNLKAYGIINRADAVGSDNHDSIEILKEHIFCVPCTIGQRKAFSNAASEGLGVIEMKQKDKKAIEEMEYLYSFLYENDGKNKSKRHKK